MRHLLAVMLVALTPLAAHAAPGDPQCGADLARADALVSKVAARDRGGPVKPEAICGVLRENLRDMTEANAIMRRCMTGHALRENVGQMEASMADVRMVISKRCH